MEKRCCACGETKPATSEFFFADKRKKTGYISRCKPCWRDYQKAWHERNPDKKRQYGKTDYARNQEQRLAYKIKWRDANREKVRQVGRDSRRANRWKKYGLTKEEYLVLQASYSDGCSICGRVPAEGERSLGVDHHHATGRVRGWLCHRCNLCIGILDDNPDLFDSAARYLRGEA
jgi:hypothetical protein